ncbi:MAG: DUF2846 domain-containing protein [Gammaproteobacteria bacterium]|nr:DUF2846 domain-containing protein [Gammaproteobacteria bacterium]MDH5512825.1 DUF2846 domain-containing protein [Gammaproteobacteria bacterium]
MRNFKVVLLAVVMLLGTGCAATGPKYTDVAASIPPLASTQGRVYFFRPDTVFGAAVTSDIHLNGKIVGRSERGSFFFVDEAPGNMTVATSTEVEKQLTFTLAAGETKYVKTSVSFGVVVGRINPELVNSAEGKAALEGLAYTGTALK